ncbi:putative ribonuclease H-like domain-containing protein [Tanacetum coccineum]
MECRALRNQGNRNGDTGYRSKDNTRRIIPVETSDALVVQDNALILGLESVEAQLVVHQKNEVLYEEKITVLEFEVKDKGNAITRLTKQLDETLREKEDLKAKLEQFETSSKNLTKLINSQISSKDKTGLGYGDQLNENDSSGSELFNSVFDSRSSDGDDNQTNDRFKKDNGYHVVPPPLTGNYIPPLADLSFAELDDSIYRPTANKTSASVSQVETSITPPSNTSVEMPRVESVRPSGVIIEDWVSDDDEDIFQNEFVKTGKQADKPKLIPQNPKADIKYGNVLNTKVSKEKVNTIKVNGVNTAGQIAVSTIKGNGVTAVKASAGSVWRPKMTDLNNGSKDNSGSWISKRGNPQQALKYKRMFNSGCSRHMTGNKALLTDYQDIDGGFVAFGGSTKGGKITDLTCLFAKAIVDESKLWHRRLGHVNFKTMNKLVKGNLVRGLPSKTFENDHTCVACQKGKQHKASFAERKNRALIEAARTMLADSLLPIVFWVETVNTACYVLNRVLVTKPHNKTPYELIIGRAPSISFMRPFGCPVIILNTLDPLGKFDGKAEEGFLVGYSVHSKAFRVFNTETRKVEENLHVNFLKNKPNVAGQGPNWLFDIDSLTNSMNYQPVTVGNQTNKNAGPQETMAIQSSYDKDEDDTVDDDACKKTVQEPASKYDQALKNVLDKMMDQEKEATEQSDAVRKEFEAQFNTASASRTFSPVGPSSGPSFVPFGRSFPIDVVNLPHDPLMPELEDTAEIRSTGIFGNAYDDHDLETLNTPYVDQSVGAEADFNNMEPSTVISPIPITRVHSTHPKAQIIGDPKSAVQTRGMTKKNSGEHAMISYIQKHRRTNQKDFQKCLFSCFLSQHEPTKICQPLNDESWVEAMQEELLQFKIQKVWTLVDLPSGKKAIDTKCVYRNKKDERLIVVRNKARLVTQGYKQEEGIDYDKVFAPVARVEAIRVFLAFASFMNFPVYQMDVKSAFLYGTIEEEVYVCQPPGFMDPEFPEKVYKVEKSLYGLHQAPRAWFQMSSIGELTFFLALQVKQKEDGIFISQDKYVGEILKKFGFSSIRTASTPMETNKALIKDEDGEDVDVYLYRFQVHLKVSHLNVVKRSFRYLKDQPKLGLWYPKDSPLILEAFSDSDYAGASLDRKSTTGDLLTKAFVVSRFNFLVASIGKRGRDTKIPQSGGPPIKVGDEAVHKELGNRMKRAATTASSLEVEQDSAVEIFPPTALLIAYRETASATTNQNGEIEIIATIDGRLKTVIESSIRRHLKLEDSAGINSLPNAEVFEQLTLMGYVSDSDSLTFLKGHFSP